MSDLPIIRARFKFESEFLTCRNWWVRDPRIAGMPVSLFLYLCSHAEGYDVTPARAKADLGLTDYAWKKAKDTLRRYGFVIEVRDRYPAGSRAPMMKHGKPVLDRKARPRLVDMSGNLRVRLFTNDPTQGTDLGEDGGVIEVAEPYEQWLEKQQSLISGGAQSTAPRNSGGGETPPQNQGQEQKKPQVSTAPRNSWGGAPVDEIRDTHIKEEENQGWDGKGKSLQSSPSNSNHARGNVLHRRQIKQQADQSQVRFETTGDHGLAVDRELVKIHPTLTMTSLTREIRGRVDLTLLDVVFACREILAANKQPDGINYPPSYCAKSIVAAPERWLLGVTPYTEDQTTEDSWPDTNNPSVVKQLERAACERGEHDWGSSVWPEIDRSVCVRPKCDVRRRNVDSTFAELEDEQFTQQSIGETSWVE